MVKFYTVSKSKTCWLYFRSWAPYCQIQAWIEKVEKITRPFRYDLNQIPYEYTVEVMNRFKKLDLIDRLPEELWVEVHNIIQRQWPKMTQRKRNTKRQSGYLRRLYKWLRKEEKWKAKEKGEDIPKWMQNFREQQEIRRSSSVSKAKK